MTTTERPAPDARAPRTVDRRSVLRWAGIGVGSAVVAGGVVAGVRGTTNGGFAAGSGAPYDLWRDWTALTGVDRVVAAGVLAANPHNTQPWRIRAGDARVEVYSDPRRRMPANDASGREHYAGLGCAVENMVVAAGGVGLAAEVTPFPDPGSPDLVARLTLRPGPERDGPLARAVPDRHTNRGPYETRPVAGTELGTLTALASGVSGATVRWVTAPAAVRMLGALYVEATEAIAADAGQSEEAFSWFRNDRADVDRHRDGLTLDCQGLSGPTLFAAKVLPARSRTDGDAFWVAATRDVHTATAAAYGVVTVPDVLDRGAQVAGGRLLARLHLAATSRGLGFHHMNQITERIDRDRATGRPDVFSARWGAALGVPASTGLVSFRIGYPERAAGLSPRRALADVVDG